MWVLTSPFQPDAPWHRIRKRDHLAGVWTRHSIKPAQTTRSAYCGLEDGSVFVEAYLSPVDHGALTWSIFLRSLRRSTRIRPWPLHRIVSRREATFSSVAPTYRSKYSIVSWSAIRTAGLMIVLPSSATQRTSQPLRNSNSINIFTAENRNALAARSCHSQCRNSQTSLPEHEFDHHAHSGAV